MHTTDRYGGMTLGAFAGDRMVGYSYALPGFDGTPFLLSCGLAVARGFESRGIGESLKRAQAEHARRAGYDLVRWTTNSLASGPLRLYLSKLGARLVRYHEDMYAPLRDSLFPDEVEIEWDLRAAGAARAGPAGALNTSRSAGAEHRRLTGVAGLESLSAPSYRVEIPWDRGYLERRAPELGQEWMSGVRLAMQALLAQGYAGTALQAERGARRSFVRFDRVEG